MQTINAAPDRVRVVRLDDGSRVTLDSGAALTLAYSGTERRLRLLQGHARFDVAHDPGRPFIVDAGLGSVIAHGTLFDVLDGASVRVDLLRGSVEVRGQPASTGRVERRLLAPGQQIVVGADLGLAPVIAAPETLHGAGGMISFDRASLGEAIAAFNRTSGEPIRRAGTVMAGRRLSAPSAGAMRKALRVRSRPRSISRSRATVMACS